MIKACLWLGISFFSLPSLSWAQDNNGTSLQTAFSANAYLKKENQELRAHQQQLINALKALTQQNTALKQYLYKVLQQKETPLPSLSNRQLVPLRKELEDAHYDLGVMLQEQERFDDAIKEYEKVLQINSDDADAHYNLALIYDAHQNDPQRAIEHYQKYLELAPHDPQADGVRDSIQRLDKMLGGIS